MSEWIKENGRGCADCPSPAAWCRACAAEADRDRLTLALEAMTLERNNLSIDLDAYKMLGVIHPDEAAPIVAAERDRAIRERDEFEMMLHENEGPDRTARRLAEHERDSLSSELTRLRVEVERMAKVYEAAVEWHREDRAMERGHDRIDAMRASHDAAMRGGKT